MSNELVDQVMKEVMKQMGNEEKPASSSFKANPGITEFVGTAEGDTIGLVIANLDAQVAKLFGLDKEVPLHRYSRCANRRRSTDFRSR